MSTLNSEKLPNLTSLRFVLASLVVLFHVAEFSANRGFPFFNELAIFNKGEEAVYMFFSLSGFLIIKQLYDEKANTNTINLKGFYLRRILRIFPLYYLVLTIGFIYYHFILDYFDFEFENNYNVFHGLLLSLTFFSNIFSTYSPGGILEILWSIGIEEQFYLLIAPLFFLLPKKKVIPFLSLFTGIYFLMYFSESLSLLEEYKMLFFYFSFGGICAILLSKNKNLTILKKIKYPILILCVLYFTTALFVDSFNSFFYHLFSVLLFGMFLSVFALEPIRLFQNKSMTYLGKISYGIYMYHAIMIQLVGFIYLKLISQINLPDAIDIILINVLVLSLTILISHFSYRYYEGYFLKFKQRPGIIRNTRLVPKTEKIRT